MEAHWKGTADAELGPAFARFTPSLGSMMSLAMKLFGWVCLVALPLAWWQGRTPEELARGALAAGLVFVGLGLLLGALVRPLGLRVFRDGLVGRTYWGPKKLLRWEEIGHLDTDHSSGVALLLIVARSGNPILWTLPGVVEEPEFQRLASQLGGSDGPLVAPGRTQH